MKYIVNRLRYGESFHEEVDVCDTSLEARAKIERFKAWDREDNAVGLYDYFISERWC